jgi:DNA helicase-2/ATP-dependent DNA helicase PcrA
MTYVRPDLWIPVDVDSLEPTAEEVVRSSKNILVVAGPGAGKTELLAQRACYLLATGSCPAPRRILAISFKRDAAKNLGERVRKRFGERANRFDSFTLDAFAKGLVDRFRGALPGDWRPKPNYTIMTRSLPVHAVREWLDNAGVPQGHEPIDVKGAPDTKIKRAFDLLVHGFPLPYDGSEVKPLWVYFGLRWWKEQLAHAEDQQSLTFPMLNRLAAFLLRQNPKLTAALRATYSFVFLDEFQDTTSSQYDLIRSAFQGTTSVLTAVGDSKQRIMLWAGAMQEVFASYKSDFGAETRHLIRNYRSAPELVRMQHVIAQEVEAGTPPSTPTREDTTGTCVLMEFSTPEDEASHIAALIDQGIREEGRAPRDFCILVRQRTEKMIEYLKSALTKRGIRLRDETQLQDLLVEPAVRFLLAILRLATKARDPEAWDILTSETAVLLGLDEEDDAPTIERECLLFLQNVRTALAEKRDISTLPAELMGMVGSPAFMSAYRQYGTGSYLSETIEKFSSALKASAKTSVSPRDVVDDFIGKDVVPAMTIHKSKGLEFNTVIFLGLEDSQWWAFANQADEEKRSFFVAFSRASDRVYFTFCDERDGRWGREVQQKAQIGDLFNILKEAGVPLHDFRARI